MDTNPYNPLHPTADPAHFFGRDEISAFFRQHLVGAPHEHALVVIGQRGMGKSSALHQLRFLVDDRYRLCVIDVAALDPLNGETLVAALMDAVCRTLEQAEASTYRVPDGPDPDKAAAPGFDLLDWFLTDYLEIALAALRQRFLVLAFDDAHLLLDAAEQGALPADLTDRLAAALADQDRLDIVCALDAAYEDRALAIDMLSDPALYVRLKPLSPDDAEWLIWVPFGDMAAIDDDAVARIKALAGGHPFLLHSVCRLLYRRSEGRGHAGPITVHDLEAIHPAVLAQAEDVLRPLWDSTTQNEQLALTALVQLDASDPAVGHTFDAVLAWIDGTNYVLNKTRLAAALRSLDYKALVQTDGELYRVPAGLIADWVRDHTTIQHEPATRAALDRSRLVPIVGVIVVILLVAALGIAALSGAFDSDGDAGDPGVATREMESTATLTPDLFTPELD
jgi:hypothetical protein